MKSFTVIVERCPDTNLYVGHVPGFPGAHSQGDTLDELRQNMTEVMTMLLENGLRGTVLRYDQPTSPIAEADWDALQ